MTNAIIRCLCRLYRWTRSVGNVLGTFLAAGSSGSARLPPLGTSAVYLDGTHGLAVELFASFSHSRSDPS